jgi:hypothetical protein
LSKVRNKRHYSKDHDYLKSLAEECEKYVGREYELDLKNDTLIVFALPRRHKKSPKLKEDRDKRKEKFERRER